MTKENIETMKTEENNRMEALACIIADLKIENVMLEQRVHKLVDDYNDVVRQLNGNERPRRLAKAFYAFVKDRNLYMKKATDCPYYQDCPHVCSTFCLECDSCLDLIEGLGVICEKRLLKAK